MVQRKDSSEEYVLVLPTPLLWQIRYFQGLCLDAKVYETLVPMLEKALFKKRREVENDPTYKQIIPYVLLSADDTFFSYRRGKLMSEARLIGTYSIGIGGHISTSDLTLLTVPYRAAMIREVLEEVDLQTSYDDRIVGLINDDSNDVGRVHFGIVHLFRLREPHVVAREMSINEAKFRTAADLTASIVNYENWSRMCIEHLEEITRRA